MTEPTSSDRPSPTLPKPPVNDRYARLKAEAIAPYRGLRKFIYGAFAASGAIGAFVFLMQAIAGRDVDAALPNLALQVGIVALMVVLFRLEGRSQRK